MRLAYERGALSRPSTNPFQSWALNYWLSYDRWDSYDRRDDLLKRFLFHIDPKRYFEVYPLPKTELLADKEFLEQPVDPGEFADIDAWLRSADKGRVGQLVDLDDDEGWV